MRIKSVAVNGIALLTLGGALAGCKGSGSDTAAAPTPTQVTTSDAAAAPEASASPAAPPENGVAKLTATEIVAKAKAALKSAKSFRAVGAGTDGGQKMTIDMEVSGTDALGKLTIGQGATVQLLSVGGKHYMKPNEAFWVKVAGAPAADAKKFANLVGDRWVIVSAKNADMKQLFNLVNIDEMVKLDGKLSKGTAKQIDSYQTIGVKSSGGDTLYVATTGKPYPIEEVEKDGKTTFSDFGTAFTDLKKPAAAEVVDLNI
ncbi:hypothetical protein [Actinoplanes subtropicus]|uniref:hypothetical protein n=1 Tax=Actinoplanes subtropicus TaxID=543632 RepID=UPI0004C405EB|nr:hypothetical protein [Actinoplanes subtropicus]